MARISITVELTRAEEKALEDIVREEGVTPPESLEACARHRIRARIEQQRERRLVALAQHLRGCSDAELDAVEAVAKPTPARS